MYQRVSSGSERHEPPFYHLEQRKVILQRNQMCLGSLQQTLIVIAISCEVE